MVRVTISTKVYIKLQSCNAFPEGLYAFFTSIAPIKEFLLKPPL